MNNHINNLQSWCVLSLICLATNCLLSNHLINMPSNKLLQSIFNNIDPQNQQMQFVIHRSINKPGEVETTLQAGFQSAAGLAR
uniref:Uncharacterized protein n=1 Tax=Arundo donax TaxID=35708 RepID=A0A0A9BM81_ARUDO